MMHQLTVPQPKSRPAIDTPAYVVLPLLVEVAVPVLDGLAAAELLAAEGVPVADTMGVADTGEAVAIAADVAATGEPEATAIDVEASEVSETTVAIGVEEDRMEDRVVAAVKAALRVDFFTQGILRECFVFRQGGRNSTLW